MRRDWMSRPGFSREEVWDRRSGGGVVLVFSAERAKEDQTRKERGTGEVAEAGGEEQERGAGEQRGKRGGRGRERGGGGFM